MAEPPSSGGVKLTEAELSLGVAVPMVGAAGAVGPGVTALDGAEAGPVPDELEAVTVKV
jgi:hypothetical protein